GCFVRSDEVRDVRCCKKSLDQAAWAGRCRRCRNGRRRAVLGADAGTHFWCPIRVGILRSAIILSSVLLPAAGGLSRLRLGLALGAAALEPLGSLGPRQLPPELLRRALFAGDPGSEYADPGRVERHHIGAIAWREA